MVQDVHSDWAAQCGSSTELLAVRRCTDILSSWGRQSPCLPSWRRARPSSAPAAGNGIPSSTWPLEQLSSPTAWSPRISSADPKDTSSSNLFLTFHSVQQVTSPCCFYCFVVVVFVARKFWNFSRLTFWHLATNPSAKATMDSTRCLSWVSHRWCRSTHSCRKETWNLALVLKANVSEKVVHCSNLVLFQLTSLLTGSDSFSWRSPFFLFVAKLKKNTSGQSIRWWEGHGRRISLKTANKISRARTRKQYSCRLESAQN